MKYLTYLKKIYTKLVLSIILIGSILFFIGSKEKEVILTE